MLFFNIFFKFHLLRDYGCNRPPVIVLEILIKKNTEAYDLIEKQCLSFEIHFFFVFVIRRSNE